MEVYSKASSVPEAEEIKEPCEVQIKSGKKIKACISQALKILQTTKEKVIITGSGPTVTKVITTAEIVKRKVKSPEEGLTSKTSGLHQENTLFYSKVEDVWDPKQEGLDRLKVTRKIPSIRILLSKVSLDDKALGYQAPGVSQPMIQFRDEDIELADAKYEGKNSLRQSPHQQLAAKGKTGFKNDRKQKQKPHTKHSNKNAEERSETEKANGTHKDHEEKRSVPQGRGTRRKHGGHHGGQQPSKRQHSEKEKPDQKTETPKSESKPEKTRTPQASS